MPDRTHLPLPFALRGPFLTSCGDPFVDGVDATRRYESDGVVVVAEGKIADAGPARQVLARLPERTPVERLPRGTMLAPGFVD